jgi:predicted small metal-binding protein
MKQMTCKQMGGPCDAVITGNTAEEMVKNGGEHVMAANHTDIAEQMKNMTPEQNAKWMADFTTKFEAAAEM